MVNRTDIYNAKILIVDDLEPNIRLLERMLLGAGYTAITAITDPRVVCELHLKNRYDLILLDLQMPGMDGFQVMEGLKQIETEGYLPVLVITAQPGHKLRALEAGAKDFISKPFDLAEVSIRVYNMLEVRLLHMETKHLYEQVLVEQKLSERLLLNVLPHEIAERLKGRTEVSADSFNVIIADSFADVTVLFADIVGFTDFSAGISPEKLVVLLNEIFSDFDSIADLHGLEKIKTIGDAYMAVAGIPVPLTNHVARAAHMALDMMDALDAFNQRNHYTLEMRIGISSGAVVAGVIGKHKFIYDLWGDTVNTASRMESQGIAMKIQMTDYSRQQLDDTFYFEQRGLINIKGKGEMLTWFLRSRND
jgi:adenylate cyclase